MKNTITPLLASKPDHYLRSHRMLQSSNESTLTQDEAWVFGKILYVLIVVPVIVCLHACGCLGRREETAVEPATKVTTASPAV